MFKFVRIIHNAFVNTLKTKTHKLFKVYNTLNVIKICSISDDQRMDTEVRWFPASILGFPLINKTPVLLVVVQLSPQGEIAFPFFQYGNTYDILSNEMAKDVYAHIWKIYRIYSNDPKCFFFFTSHLPSQVWRERSHRRTEDQDFLALKACHANKTGFYFFNSS